MTGESNPGRTTRRGWFDGPHNNASEALRARLRQGDPADGDAGLTAEEASAMRRLVVSSAAERPAIGLAGALAKADWWRAAAVGALGTAAIAIGVLLQNGDDLRWLRPGGQLPGEPKATQTAPAGRPDEARQIQFSTPGGTRIIWLLDPAFKL